MVRRQQGFTLMELLVATMLLSIVMTAVYSAFHTSLNTWNAVEKEFEAYREARAAVHIFERELSCMLTNAAHLFEGDNKEVTMFAVTEPMDVEDSEGPHLMRVRYYYQRSQRTLMREEAMVETALPKAPPRAHELDRQRIKLGRKKKRVIANNVDRFDLEYIWIPQPPPRPDPKTPPSEVEPIVAREHRERWGMPQGIHLRMCVIDPVDRERTFPVDIIIPIRIPNYLRARKSIQEMLADVS